MSRPELTADPPPPRITSQLGPAAPSGYNAPALCSNAQKRKRKAEKRGPPHGKAKIKKITY